MTELSDLLQGAVDRGTTPVEALARIQKAGLKADKGQLYKALKGDHAEHVTEPILEAWAFGFGLDIRDLRRAMRVPIGEKVPFTPHPLANRMSRDQRKAVNNIIRVLVESATDATSVRPPEDVDAEDLTLPAAESRPS